MSIDTTIFIDAELAFIKLKQQASIEVPSAYKKHFYAATLATTVLTALGAAQLSELVVDETIHSSTLIEGSLQTAVRVVSDYGVLGKRLFNRDEYEQLRRSCYSAGRFLKKCDGNFTPEF